MSNASNTAPSPSYIAGLDLGQTTDPTALCILERPAPTSEKDDRRKVVYSVRHLQRFPLGTPYTDIVPAVAKIVDTPPLKGHVTLCVDQTGVGRAVVDAARQLCPR